jgi:hypothetical protein
MEQIGRELQKIWPTDEMSPRLRELFDGRCELRVVCLVAL